MNAERAESTTPRIARPADAIFAATILTLGIVGLAQGGFTQPWSGVPKTLPARTALAYACACAAVLSGIGLLWRRTALAASRTLLGAFVLWMLFFRLPALVGAPTSSGAWWGIGEYALLVATALVLRLSLVAAGDGARSPANGDRWLRAARAMFGLGLIPIGIAHFTYLERTVSMVPGWLPGHLAIAILTGIAFIAAGVAMIVGVCARLAATLVTVQMAGFTVLVWIPIIIAHPTASDWGEFTSSCLLTAAGWVVADSYRRAPRPAVVAEVAPSHA